MHTFCLRYYNNINFDFQALCKKVQTLLIFFVFFEQKQSAFFGQKNEKFVNKKAIRRWRMAFWNFYFFKLL